tara:strand:+ start:78 stop:2654 length:2577 start_codon:yes stop_codon:yes gene_type:complete
MKFKTLELTGFKSFMDKTNFLIEDGLTGVVGPNGCGKSNIVEAIKWCMGETSAKSMRGSGMEDVIFAGAANRPSKNIAEVTLTLDNSEKKGPAQFDELEKITIKRRIEKDKGSRYYMNDKEVRARDAQTFFADLSTGAHSPSIISQGRIGLLVTAKPTDRRAILEEAAGISGIHARRHESELRLNAAENNLKRADELKRQEEKQLSNLKKQAEEASKFKVISEEIKKIEAGLYFIKIKEIENEIILTKEIANESADDVSALKIEINHSNKLLDDENLKLKPLRDKNLEILSKLQRLNLELKNLESEEDRAKEEKARLLKSNDLISADIEREKNIISNAESNEKRLNEEKTKLIDNEKNYFELEKQSELNLENAKSELKNEQKSLEEISKKLASSNGSSENITFLKETQQKLVNSIKLINEGSGANAIEEINSALSLIENKISILGNLKKENVFGSIEDVTEKIKTSQEKYANALSKNQMIKTDSIKRHERITNIDGENENWVKLKSNSLKMLEELSTRKNELQKEIEKNQTLPENIAVRKGQYMQNTSTTESERDNLSKELTKAEEKYNEINNSLKLVQEKMTSAREKKARSEAMLEGFNQRKTDLLNRVSEELNIEEKNLFEYSDLDNINEIPDAVEQEEKLDARKRQREAFGSVNLRADVETVDLQKSIKKMEEDREDLVSAISKLRSSINELNQKGRERLVDAFEKVNRKFNEVYTKLFNGGSAKLELVESDDPLEAGLEMLVSPPGKRLQSITLLSGGEQALTALSLIFAVFLTSPAPICILDEVDAPLDDANVTRFCALLDELIKITETKFIIITHHALTMSRMNRLYGVTMPEKGISQLVAVDLEKAEEMVA